jgi:hypothetical protein
MLRGLQALGLVAVVAAAALGANPVQAQRLGECVRVELDAPVLLPDGSIREVGLLRLCLDRKMNPIAGLHEIQLDGAAQLVVSRIGEAEADAAAGAVVVFDRGRSGELRLVGYAVPDGDRIVTFLIGSRERGGNALRASAGLLAQPGTGEERIWIAAYGSQ